MRIFKQRRLLNTREIEFKEKGIQYFSGNFLNSKSIFIPYEEIETENFNREFKTDKFNFIVALISLSFLVKSIFHVLNDERTPWFGIMLISAIFFVVFLIVTLLGRKHSIFIQTYSGYAFELFDKKPNETELNKFLEELKNNSFSYLRKTYAVVDSDLPIDSQLEMINALKKRNIISSEEFEELKQKINLNKII